MFSLKTFQTLTDKRKARLVEETKAEISVEPSQTKGQYSEKSQFENGHAHTDGDQAAEGQSPSEENRQPYEVLTRNMNVASAKDLGQLFKEIFTSPSFILITIAGIVENGAVMGFAAFLPKFIQQQFNQTPAFAALLTGRLGNKDYPTLYFNYLLLYF